MHSKLLWLLKFLVKAGVTRSSTLSTVNISYSQDDWAASQLSEETGGVSF